MLSREVDSTFRALCYRKQRRNLARLKISERAARKRVLMPDITQAGVELSIEPAEQISHLPKRETLAIFLTHRAKIQRALAAGIRNQYAGLAILIESRRIGVLNRQIAQPVTAQSRLLPNASTKLQVAARHRRKLQFINRVLLVR